MKLAKFAFVCAAVASLTAVADDVSSTLAILPVTKTLNAMPLTVNFTDANGAALSASNIVKTANLPVGSALYVYDGVSAYTKYNLSGTAWVPTNDGKKYVVNSSGQLEASDASAASDVTVAPGAAVFVETPANQSVTFYVAGKPASGATTTITAGANLIGAPTAAAFNLNSDTAVFSNIAESTFTTSGNKIKSYGDIIQVPTSDGGLATQYFYRLDTANSANSGWVKANGSGGYTKDNCIIPAGQGFWYIRKAGTDSMTITWQQQQ